MTANGNFAAADSSGLLGINCDTSGIRLSSAFGNTNIYLLVPTSGITGPVYIYIYIYIYVDHVI